MKPIARILLAALTLFAVACQSSKPQDQAAGYGQPDSSQNPYGTNPYYGQQTYPQNPYQGSGDYADVTAAPPPSTPTYQDPGYGQPASGAPAAGPRTHVVERGQTLYRISKMYGTTVENIKSVNGLSSDLIHPGDVLNIP